MVNTLAMSGSITVSRHVNASPEQVWGLVTDLPRMGEWSPENNGGSWQHGANVAAFGAKFKGLNSNGKKRWSTIAKVTALDAPRSFAFDVTAVGVKIATWRYDIAASAGGGSTVSETWTDNRGWFAKKLGGQASGVADREAHNRAGMERTLEAMAAAAEAG
jgi:uncharacterized protein YndB with AHSA1/START domain